MFGFSAGDFLATVRLIKDIINALQSSSTSEFRELTLELYGLTRALHEIEHLRPSADHECTINAVKVAALMCKHPLDEFMVKLKKYEALDQTSLNTKDRINKWKLKLQWGLTMEDEVQRIRAYLAAHIASLNTRLLTQGLISSSLLALEIGAAQEEIADIHKAVLDIKIESQTQKGAIYGANSLLQVLVRLVQYGIFPQLSVLIGMIHQIWETNVQIVRLLIRLQTTIQAPDLCHTWFQPPCRFEDALGRVLPVPSEYSFSQLQAIISDQFRTGPGRENVLFGEYELFNRLDTSQRLSGSELDGLVPGMDITMAFVIGRSVSHAMNICPRPKCLAQENMPVKAGGRVCKSCNAWFDVRRGPVKHQFRFTLEPDTCQKMNDERHHFKNIIEYPMFGPGFFHHLHFWAFWCPIRNSQNPSHEVPTSLAQSLQGEDAVRFPSLVDSRLKQDFPLRKLDDFALRSIIVICEHLGISMDKFLNRKPDKIEPGLPLEFLLCMLGLSNQFSPLNLFDSLPWRSLEDKEFEHSSGEELEVFMRRLVKRYSNCLLDIPHASREELEVFFNGLLNCHRNRLLGG
ncbi:MAG: hypothetical protein Q9167_001187 [Letrouitia subvulpina]